MVDLDALLFDAWHRLSDELRRDRVRAMRRSRRQHEILTRPMRSCCLVLRASDTRINDYFTTITPAGAFDARQPHRVELTGRLIRMLTKPVMIDWPGVTYDKAAALLGREYQTVAYWAYQGVFQIRHDRMFRRPNKGRPHIWTESPIDPNAPRGRTPHPVWGTLWQWLWEKMPENYELVVDRAPRFRQDRGTNRFHGWYFICPGKLDNRLNWTGCGRRTTYLYAPQTVWTIARYMNDDRGFDMPEDSGLAGQWLPGLSDPIKAAGPRSFACRHCWKVRNQSWADATGWNEFISHISGGLLFGRDVPRPPTICPIVRQRPYKSRPGANDKRYAKQRAEQAAKVQQQERRVG